MKKKLIALVCALALAVGLVGCSLSTPDSVGTIGNVDISSGLYLLAQFDAYQTAADLASDDQDATKVSSFLKATITVDDATGETAVVSDYVAQKTLENLESYAAIETRFDELGGVLTPDEEMQADSYASQLMEQNGDLYKANGIGLDTLKRFERILIKSNDLLEMCYGTDGETPVSDAELTSHLEDEMVYIRYVVVPLYNTSTFAFADDAQSAQMLELAQTAAESCNAAIPDGASAQTTAFSAARKKYQAAHERTCCCFDNGKPCDARTHAKPHIVHHQCGGKSGTFPQAQPRSTGVRRRLFRRSHSALRLAVQHPQAHQDQQHAAQCICRVRRDQPCQPSAQQHCGRCTETGKACDEKVAARSDAHTTQPVSNADGEIINIG